MLNNTKNDIKNRILAFMALFCSIIALASLALCLIKPKEIQASYGGIILNGSIAIKDDATLSCGSYIYPWKSQITQNGKTVNLPSSSLYGNVLSNATISAKINGVQISTRAYCAQANVHNSAGSYSITSIQDASSSAMCRIAAGNTGSSYPTVAMAIRCANLGCQPSSIKSEFINGSFTVSGITQCFNNRANLYSCGSGQGQIIFNSNPSWQQSSDGWLAASGTISGVNSTTFYLQVNCDSNTIVKNGGYTLQNGTVTTCSYGSGISVYARDPSRGISFSYTCYATDSRLAGYRITSPSAGQDFIFVASRAVSFNGQYRLEAPVGNFRLNKTGIGGTPLSGASFRLQNNTTGKTYTLQNSGSGYYSADNLPVGNYTLTETSAPFGYRVSSESISVSIIQGTTVNKSLTNTPKTCTVSFNKEFLIAPGCPLRNLGELDLSRLSFTAVGSSDRVPYNFTRSGATFTCSNLPQGQSYTLVENGQIFRNGVLFSEANGQVITTFTPNSDLFTLGSVINFSRTSMLTISKYGGYNSTDYGFSLSGAGFQISGNVKGNGNEILGFTGSNGNYTYSASGGSQIIYSGPSGTIIISGLPVGVSYSATEVSAPTGYQASPGNFLQTPVLAAAENLSFINIPERGNLSFIKTNIKSGLKIDGAKFVLQAVSVVDPRLNGKYFILSESSTGKYSLGSNPIDSISSATTSATEMGTSSGTCTINNLIPGQYKVIEVSAPDGFTIADPIIINVSGNTTNSSNTYKDSPETKNVVIGKKGPWNEWIAGDSENQQYFVMYNKTTGKPVKLTYVSDGKYTYSNDNYTNDTSYAVNSAKNNVVLSEICSASGDNFVFEVSKTDGTATINDVPNSNINNTTLEAKGYYIKELTAAKYYEVLSDDVDFNIASGNVSVKNERIQTGEITFLKTNKFNKSVVIPGTQFVLKTKPEGNSSFGSRYVCVNGTTGVYDFDTLTEPNASVPSNAILTTGTNGKINVKKLPLGSYDIIEYKAAPFYVLSDETYSFTLEEDSNKKDLCDVFENPMTDIPETIEMQFAKVGDVDKEVISDCNFILKCNESSVSSISNTYIKLTGTSGNYIYEKSNYNTKYENYDNINDFLIKTDNTGLCKIAGLPEGKYQLIELKSDSDGSLYDPYTDIDVNNMPTSNNDIGFTYEISIFNTDGKGRFSVFENADGELVSDCALDTGINLKLAANVKKRGSLTFTKSDITKTSSPNVFTTTGFVLYLNDYGKYVELTGSNGNYSYSKISSAADIDAARENSAAVFNVDATGTATIKDLPMGTYSVFEVKPDDNNYFKTNVYDKKPSKDKHELLAYNTCDPALKVNYVVYDHVENDTVLKDKPGDIHMENTPWGGFITFTKYTEHGTLYPDCNTECSFIVKVKSGENNGKYLKLAKDLSDRYYFVGYTSSFDLASEFTTDIELTENGHTENARAIIYDLPPADYEVIETKTGSYYSLSDSVPTAFNGVTYLKDQPDGVSGKMINYVLKAPFKANKIITNADATINNTDVITTKGFKLKIEGTSVTKAEISVDFVSDASGHFIVNKYLVDGVSLDKYLNLYEIEIPYGQYIITEYDVKGNPVYTSHAHVDSIKINDDVLWDRVENNADFVSDEESVSLNIRSISNITVDISNIIDNVDLSVKKNSGTLTSGTQNTYIFMDTNINYNISDFSNKLDTHNATLTIRDYPEKQNTDRPSLALNKIAIPGYDAIENGSRDINYSCKVVFRDGTETVFADNKPLPQQTVMFKDLSPNLDSDTPDDGMDNIDYIEVIYYNFPAKSGLLPNKAINLDFRIGGELIEYKTDEVTAKGNPVFKTFNHVEFSHSYLTDIAQDDAEVQIKKININKLNINKQISSVKNDIDYNSNGFTLVKDFAPICFSIDGYLINDDNEWEKYSASAMLDSDGFLQMPIPYGVYRLQELHSDGFDDQAGYDVISDSLGIIIRKQTDDNVGYINLPLSTNIIGRAKILNYNKFNLNIDETGILFTFNSDDTAISEIKDNMTLLPELKVKNNVITTEVNIENTLAVGTIKLDKIVSSHDNKHSYSKEGFKARIKGTSYAGVSFNLELVSDANGIFVPVNKSAYNADTNKLTLPEGIYTIEEYDIPALVYLDNIKYNGSEIWNRSIPKFDDSGNMMTETTFKLIKDVSNNMTLTNIRDDMVLGAYENTSIKFNKVFYSASDSTQYAEADDFERLALEINKDYVFKITLTETTTGLSYTGLLSSENGIVFKDIPFGEYIISENSEMYFKNQDIKIDNDSKLNASLKQTDKGYIITLSKELDNPVAFAEITIGNKLESFRGYSEVGGISNKLCSKPVIVNNMLAVSSLDYNMNHINNTTFEIYREDNISTPLNFKIVNNKIYFTTETEDTMTAVDTGLTGYVCIYDLPAGNYWIKQTSTKSGYRAANVNKAFIINEEEGTEIYLLQVRK